MKISTFVYLIQLLNMPGKRLLEICVESVPSAINAQTGGADRIELCDNLYQGGITPSAGKITLAKKHLHIPVFVLIRPRKGDFLYTPTEFDNLLEDIVLARQLGADGIVSGALLSDGNIDTARTRLMLQAAEGLPFTFHRAFDMCRDPLLAIDELAELGVQRILSSGQQPNAVLGFDNLRRFAQYAAGRISIMACGSLMPHNVGPLAEVPEIQEFHAAVRATVRSEMQYRGAVNMGDEAADEEFNWTETDVDLVAGLRRGIG
jgi:copper homeostasis protein